MTNLEVNINDYIAVDSQEYIFKVLECGAYYITVKMVYSSEEFKAFRGITYKIKNTRLKNYHKVSKIKGMIYE